MCGIAGVIYVDRQRTVYENELKSMTRNIIHRGPDDEGFYIANNVGLAFRRLSIIDVSNGKQPISNENDDVWVTMNGEIYNYQKLKSELIGLGHRFKSNSDTEVLVHLYEEYGMDFVTQLRGMFAFALFDKKANKIIFARDRIGIKPLFYSMTNEGLIFGSEIKAIKSLSDSSQINDNAIIDYFTYGYVLDNKTIYNCIKKLPPACIMELDISSFKCTISEYWKIKPKPNLKLTESEWIEEIRAKLKETIQMHMIADVPIGAFLSGGVDSSAVVSYMAQFSSEPIQTFSIGFHEEKYNELEYAKLVSQLYNTNHTELKLEPTSIGFVDSLVDIYDEPFADSSAIPTYFLSKLTRQKVTVALSGDGGDELFAGYKNYNKSYKAYKVSKLLPDFIRPFFHRIQDTIPLPSTIKEILYFLSKESTSLSAYATMFKEYELSNLFNKNFSNTVKTNSAINIKIEALKLLDERDFLTSFELLDLNTYLVDDILTKVDRASMANSIEVRVPLLDHEFVEMAFNIPSSMKLIKSEGKAIFKKALIDKLPNNVLYRKKQGFAVPLNGWFKDNLYEYLNDEMLNKNSKMYDYLDANEVEKIIKEHLSGKVDLSAKIWTMLVFHKWLEKN